MNAIHLVFLLLLGLFPQQQETGREIFLGKGNCYMCHGSNGRGTVMAPNLADTTWLNVDGSHAQIVALVKSGVPRPKRYPGFMPAMGGATLQPKEIEAVAQYVVSLRSQREAEGEHEHVAQPEDSTAAAMPGGHMCMCMGQNGAGRGCGMMRGRSSPDTTAAAARMCPRCRRGS